MFLPKGSLRSFLIGKHYNRCKRLHEILSLPMEILHLNFFMTTLDDNQIDFCKNIKLLNHCNEKEKQDVDAVINLYILFTDKTRQGLHGKSAKFWIKYVDIMHLYHAFSRSRRIGDFDLFLACIPELTSYFFALNHYNYAR